MPKLPHPKTTIVDFVKNTESFIFDIDIYKKNQIGFRLKLQEYVNLIKDLQANLRYIHNNADNPDIDAELMKVVNAHGTLGMMTLREYMATFYSNLDAASAWANDLLPKKEDPSKADPVEVIQHSVEFDLGVTGGVGPNWTLARFKGPTAGGSNLFAASRTNKHLLIITMGDPNSQTIDNSRQGASLAAALRAGGVSITPGP
jgi:hypothetical protein